MKKYFPLFAKLALVLGILYFVVRVFPKEHVHKDSHWMAELPIDGFFYLQGAWRMVHSNDWIFSPNRYNSIGFQIICATLYRIYGNFRSGYPVQLWNYFAWLGTVILLGFALFKITKNQLIALLGAFLCAFSSSFSQYASLIQYEVTAAFLCLAVCALQLRKQNSRTCLLSGVLVAFLCLIRPHFLLMPLLMGVVLYLQSALTERRKHIALFAFAFLLITTYVNVHYSIRMGRVFLFQTNIGPHMTFARDNNVSSSGVLFPRNPRQHPRGLNFVVKHPIAYAKLLVKRFGYFIGVEPHIWFVDSRWTRFASHIFSETIARWLFTLVALSLTAGGMALAIQRAIVDKNWDLLTFAFPIATVAAPLIIVNTAFRILVPAIPCIIVFQILALRYLIRRFPKNTLSNAMQ